MERLKAWLERHGLGKYAEVLAENSVDLEIIGDLEEADFAELGLDLGDRKRMMRAVRTLGARDPAPGFADAAQAYHSQPVLQGGVSGEGEKLHLTMMFVDLVGSTSLSNKLDLESFREVLHKYQLFCLETIRSHHGHIAQFIGDAVTAYFGYPTAAEDDAERAVQAGLGICEGLSRLNSAANRPLEARIGIATGEVVVERQRMLDGLAFGETPNLAARIMAATEPGTVAISDRTKQLLGAGVDCVWMGTHELKGFQTPVGIWRVAGSDGPGMRFRARQKGEILPLVDREDEMRLLESRWVAARGGTTQTVLLSGEAGIGKSRIVEALAQKIDADGGLRLNFQCSVHHKGNAFFPLVSLISLTAGLRRSDTLAQQGAKLKRVMSEWFNGADFDSALGLFANLLSIPAEAVGLQTELSPERLKSSLQHMLLGLARRLSVDRPLFLLFEDLHWVDPSTEELIELLIETLGAHRVLILCTSRPEYKYRWTGRARVTALSIARLDNAFARQMMRNVMSRVDVSPEMESQIIEKSDGVPLFVEEMSRMVRQRIDRPEAMQERDELVALPSTLKDLLRAQIDALVTARETVPVCAAIGRTILPSMVEAVTGLSAAQTRAQLDYLAEVEILVPRGNRQERSYAFRHALIQDAAYDLMLSSRARALHKAIANVIVETHQDLAAQQPDLLAEHYTRAKMPAEARDAWREAAKQATNRAATEESILHLEYALRENDKLEDAETRDAEEIALRKMFNVALNTRAFGSRPVIDNFRKLHSLLTRSSASPEDAFLALHVQFGAQLMLTDAQNSLSMCPEMERIGRESNDVTMQTMAAHNRAMATFMLSRFDEAITQFDAAIKARPKCTAEDIFRYHAADIYPVDLAMRCWALALRGDAPDAVRAAISEALTHVEQEEHAFSRCYAFNILATAYQAIGETAALLELVDKALTISDQHNFQYWAAWSAIMRGWARARMGEATSGIEELQEGLAAYHATGSTQITQFANTLLADAYAQGGDAERALALIEEVKASQKEGAISYHLGITAQLEATLRK